MLNNDNLGNYIELVDERNTSNVTSDLLGINIDKYFMPSVANVIGTDLSKYKLLKKGYFACNPMHVGRDDKLPVALYRNDKPAIVSPAYFMFKIKNNKVLDDEYLMLQFKKKDFDRECTFMTDGSVRGGLLWEDLCRIKISIPSIEDQKQIVSSYKTVEKRIEVLKRINDNLNKIIQVIFRQCLSEDKEKIMFNEFAIFQEGPGIRNWQFQNIGIPFLNIRCLVNNDINVALANKISFQDAELKYKHFMLEIDDMVLSTSGTLGKFAVIRNRHLPLCLNTSIIRPKNCKEDYSTLYCILKSSLFIDKLYELATGSAQVNLGPTQLNKISVNVPKKENRDKLHKKVFPLINKIEDNLDEIYHLNKFNLLNYC